MGLKGHVVIPKQLRDSLGIRPGDLLDFWLEGDHVSARRVRDRASLRGRLRGMDLTADLETSRAADRDREDSR